MIFLTKSRGHLIPTILILALLSACKPQHKTNKTLHQEFHIPIVLQEPSNNSIEYTYKDFLDGVSFIYFGKFKFTDTLLFDIYNFSDTAYPNDYIWGQSQPYFGDTLTTDGFQIFADYQTNIYLEGEYLAACKY